MHIAEDLAKQGKLSNEWVCRSLKLQARDDLKLNLRL